MAVVDIWCSDGGAGTFVAHSEGRGGWKFRVAPDSIARNQDRTGIDKALHDFVQSHPHRLTEYGRRVMLDQYGRRRL